MDSPLRRRGLSVLVVVLALVLVPVGAAWAFWVVNATALSSTGAAATVPAATGFACTENGDAGVTLSWNAATPAAPSAYGYTVSFTQVGPAWAGTVDAAGAVSASLTPTSLGGSHNGEVVANVTTRYTPSAPGAATWTSVPSGSDTFYVKTKYFLWIFPYQALDCSP